MSKVIMGNGNFYGCLIEARGVSAWWKETAKTSGFLFFSFLVAEPPCTSIKQNQTLTTPRENEGTEREAPSPGLGICQFH